MLEGGIVASSGKSATRLSHSNRSEQAPPSAPRLGAVVVCGICFYREALAEFLNRGCRVAVVGTAEALDDALESIHRTSPDLVLVDVSQGDGWRLIRAIARKEPSRKIVALGVSEVESEVVASAEAGAVAYVSRRSSLEEAIDAFEAASLGEAICSPRMAGTLVRRVGVLAAARSLGDVRAQLTAREIEVLELVDRGLSNKEIGGSLSIEVATVKNHVHNILRKLDLHRRSQATAWLRARRA